MLIRLTGKVGFLPGMFVLLAATGAAALAVPTDADAAQVPGPSAGLYENHYYRCVKHVYVATNGSDANSGSSASTPWLTLQHANDSLPVGGAAAGTCIDVAPGTYAKGVSITAGGNLASPEGYVVYRCSTLDACTVTDVNAGGQPASFAFNNRQPMTGNYVMIDGFTLKAAAKTTFGQGVDLWAGSNTFTPSVHHVWILNSVISGYGQSGIQMNEGEYFFVIHNTIYNNSNAGCSAQGSGIALASLIARNGYARTPDDSFTKVYGNISTAFHNVIEWNVVHNNAITQCGNAGSPYDTDGNNIILDTLSWHGASGTVPYTPGTLVAQNIVYNGGGGGIHIYYSENVTAANNSCYNNYLDPFNSGTVRGCIDTNNSYGNTIINNIAVAVPAAPHGTCAFGNLPYAQFNTSFVGAPPSGAPLDVWSHNITKLEGGQRSCWGNFGKDGPTGENVMFSGDSYSCSANKCGTDPAWTSVGTKTVGDENLQPAGANFALKPDSPAIGYGLAESYLPPASRDAGACYHTLGQCP